MKRQNRQAGFSIIEAVIVVAAIAAIGTTGWFIYQHNKAKPTGATAGNNTTQQTTDKNTNPQPTKTTGATLDIKEWGVHLALDNTTASLYYYIKPTLPNVAYFSLRNIAAVAPNCAADKISLGAISRLTEAEQQSIVSGQTPGTAGTIHIGSYWYSAENSHAACTDGTAAMNAAVANAAPDYNPGVLLDTLNTLATD